MPFSRLSGVSILKGVAIIPVIVIANVGTIMALRKTGLMSDKDLEKFHKSPRKH
ncbi:hypothetical protein ABVK25_008264 [Lepraria finkii]|uniref:Uncharacterized protein n=1 Tax=Lepraria finkii TaxID=1340010 RepID=A0ABR4B0H1_9LECA